MSELELLIDLHLRNARQAPGADAQTLRALELCGLHDYRRGLDADRALDVADIGCGTGASTLTLARVLNAQITAIDAAPPFIDRLAQRAAENGLDAKIDARVGRMEELPFDARSLDLIWSEGAIYLMGFEAGVRAWHPLLRPGGLLALTELSWTTTTRPAEITESWQAAYPGITTVSENVRTLEQSDYEPLGLFWLPRSCWVENYYGPLRSGIEAFLERHEHSARARELVEAELDEVELYQRFGRWYGYAFYVARRCD